MKNEDGGIDKLAFEYFGQAQPKISACLTPNCINIKDPSISYWVIGSVRVTDRLDMVNFSHPGTIIQPSHA